jgi:hypothetical protein
MYNVSDAYLEAIRKPVIKYSITGTIGSNNFNAYTIKEGSFQITNQCTDTNELSLGSCAIGQLKATFCDISITRNEWLDKVITPSCSVEVSEGQYESVPLGAYTIKQVEQTAEGAQVTAYDNMFKFDKLFDATDKDFDKTGKPYYFLNKICQKCGVTLGMTQNEVNALPNGDNTMYICGVRKGTTDYANDIETYRDALFYLAQACACFATINRLGRLELRPFRQSVTDYISDTDRLVGAEFADYVTSFMGIYVDSLYDGRTTYYGYDLEKLQENLAEYTERKEEEEDVVDEDEADIAEIQEKYDQGQITEEEYAEQMTAATKKLKEDEAKLKATNKYLNWLNKAIAKAQANAQGTNMDLEGNPFLQHKDSSIRSIAKVTTATELRTTIMRRLSKMEYVPFSCSSVFGIHYDLGDRIMFTDGHADDDLGCITAFDWTYNGGYSMYGYGANPDEATVRPKIEKAMKQANENALNRADIGMVEVDDNVPEGSPKPVVVRKRSAASSTGENWVSKVIYIWSYYKYSAGSVPQCGITRVKVSCTTGFALCTYDPGRDVYPGEDENIINGIKRHDLMITFVAIQIPMNEMDSYELPKIKFECTRVYAPDSEHALDVTPQTFSVPAGQDTMEMIGYKTVQDPDDVYLYWRLPIASIQYGAVAHGIATEYSQDSVNFYFNSMNAWTAAGIIFLDTIPDLKPGDVMLPTATSQKETAASVENIARKIAGAGSDESQYVDASFLDEGYVDGAVDVESKTLHEAIGKSIDKVFDNLDPNIREIYYNTVDSGSIDYYIKDYFHGGDANRAFEYKTYDGVEHHLTMGSGIPTLFADEYFLDEIINDSHYNLESPHARGKVYIRIGDKSGIRLVGEVGRDCSAADNPKFAMGGWGNAMRFLNNGGYALWASRDSEDDMTQYIEYSLANTEGGKTYSMSFDFHASIIAGECDIDTTRPLGILVSTSSSLDSSILDDLPLDENVWHDSDPDNMYLSFYKNFQIVTISPEGEMTLEYQHYSFEFTAQAGKDYYIYFITSAFVSEDATNRLRMRVKDFVSSEGVGVAEIKASYQGGPDYSSDEWYTAESGGGGTSDLDAIEITYADYQSLTPEEKADPDKIYFVTDYPSGNMALDDLTDVDITTPTEGQILTYDDTDDKWKNTNVDDVAPTVTEASARANLAAGDTLKTIIGKIKKFFADLKTVAFTGAYSDLSGTPTIGNGTITVQKNGTNVNTFTTNQSSNKTVNITMSKSDVGLGNVDNTSDANKPISTATQAALNAKADASDIASAKTVTGNPITLTDGSETYADELVIDLEPIQDLHGYDKPWVGGAGKNKLPMTVEGIKALNTSGTWSGNAYTRNGVTFTIQTDSNGNVTGIKANGTASANAIMALTDNTIETSNIDGFIANGCSSGEAAISIYIARCDSDGAERGSSIRVYNGDTTLNFPASTYPRTKINIYIASGKTVSNRMFYPMIRNLSETSTFVPYSNISPITGYTEVNVNRCGKNLLPMTVEGIKARNTGGTWSGNVYTKNNVTFTVLTDENGCVTGIKANASTAASANTTFYLGDINKGDGDKYINGMPATGSDSTFLMAVYVPGGSAFSGRLINVYGTGDTSFNGDRDSRREFMAIGIASGYTPSNLVFKPMLRKASVVDSTFSPYNGASLTVPLGQTVYGATVDVANGVMVIDRGYVDLGDLTWTAFSSFSNMFQSNAISGGKPRIADYISSCFDYKPNTALANLANGCFTNSNSSAVIYVKDTRYSSATEFKTAVTGQALVYELATPIAIPLTPQQLKLLKGQNYITSNGTIIHLTYQPDNAVGNAVSEAEKYADRIPHGMDLLCEHYVGGSAILIPKIDLYSMLLFISYREIGDAQHSVIVVNGSMLLPVTAFKQPYNANYIPNYGNYGIEVFFVENQNDKSLIGATFSRTNIPYIDIYGIK